MRSSEPSAKPLLAVGVFAGLTTLIYLGVAVGVHIRQVRLEKSVQRVSFGTSQETVLRTLGEPSYRLPGEWRYDPLRSFFELPILPGYQTVYVLYAGSR